MIRWLRWLFHIVLRLRHDNVTVILRLCLCSWSDLWPTTIWSTWGRSRPWSRPGSTSSGWRSTRRRSSSGLKWKRLRRATEGTRASLFTVFDWSWKLLPDALHPQTGSDRDQENWSVRQSIRATPREKSGFENIFVIWEKTWSRKFTRIKLWCYENKVVILQVALFQATCIFRGSIWRSVSVKMLNSDVSTFYLLLIFLFSHNIPTPISRHLRFYFANVAFVLVDQKINNDS